MVRNLEYEYPHKGYESVKDQFLLGKNILVAPVIQKGVRAREVVFPEGKWLGDDGQIITGPVKQTIEVPLSSLPWFRKVA